MSPRTDSYLSLCLNEAAKSPMHYRHGCIVVRGGKVIGQGYNDYRHGYDGGSLKNGQLPSADKLKRATASGLDERVSMGGQKSIENATAIDDTTRSGFWNRGITTPLSMHSEMMAIRAALSLSSTMSAQSARSLRFLEKPYSRSPGRAKRELRKQNIQQYVDSVYAEQQAIAESLNNSRKADIIRHHGGKSQVQQSCFEAYTRKCRQEQEETPQQKQSRRGRGEKAGGGSLHEEAKSSSTKHHTGQSDEFQREEEAVVTNHNIRAKTTLSRTNLNPAPKTLLQARDRTKAYNVSDRMKDSRLSGSDLYVARLRWSTTASSQSLFNLNCNIKNISAGTPSLNASAKGAGYSESPACPVATGSLHEELTGCTRTVLSTPEKEIESRERLSVSTSRPCYRCLDYMRMVGIRRVFWTNIHGGWDGGKVRDLVDALELSSSPFHEAGDYDGGAGGAGGAGVAGEASHGIFVTKHEILALRQKLSR